MFGRLKRKRDDEDEAPLVPHGFLWQATDECESPDEERVAKPATFEDNQSTSEEVAMPANVTPQPENAPPRKLGAISPPLQWPSPNIQEIARHPETRPVTHAAEAVSAQAKQEPAIIKTPAANVIVEDVSQATAIPSIAAISREETAGGVPLWQGAFRSVQRQVVLVNCQSPVELATALVLRWIGRSVGRCQQECGFAALISISSKRLLDRP